MTDHLPSEMDHGRAESGTGRRSGPGEFYRLPGGALCRGDKHLRTSPCASAICAPPRAGAAFRLRPSVASTPAAPIGVARLSRSPYPSRRDTSRRSGLASRFPRTLRRESIGAVSTIQPVGLRAQSVNLSLNSHWPAPSPTREIMSRGGTRGCAGWIPRSPRMTRLSALSFPFTLTEAPSRSWDDGWCSARPGCRRGFHSYYSPEVTHIQEQPKPLLTAPLELVVEDSAGQRLQWRKGALKFTKRDGRAG